MSRIGVAAVAVLAVWLYGCATGREKEPLVDHRPESDVLQVKVYDAWSTRTQKGSVYSSFELKPEWRFRRAPTPQTTAGSVFPGRSGPNTWELTFTPLDANYRLATGVTTIRVYWEAVRADGAGKAGRTRLVISVAENLTPSVLEFANEEKDLPASTLDQGK